MSLFEFTLFPVETITPWGEPGRPSLSWFALTLGHFHMPVGGDVLFQYSSDVSKKWSLESIYPDYQIAAFARDILGAIAAAVEPVPNLIEFILREKQVFTKLYDAAHAGNADGERSYVAWRWLDERSAWTGYLNACPQLWFARVDDEIWIQWDNSNCLADGIPVWTAGRGTHVLKLDAFVSECRTFANALLHSMHERITAFEQGKVTPQCAIDVPGLWKQHEDWRIEFDEYFYRKRKPDFTWSEVEQAIRSLAKDTSISLPRR